MKIITLENIGLVLLTIFVHVNLKQIDGVEINRYIVSFKDFEKNKVIEYKEKVKNKMDTNCKSSHCHYVLDMEFGSFAASEIISDEDTFNELNNELKGIDKKINLELNALVTKTAKGGKKKTSTTSAPTTTTSSSSTTSSTPSSFTCLSQLQPGWNLDRIDQTSSTLDSLFIYRDMAVGENGISDVDIYIIDSGINTSHPEFSDGQGGTRAFWADGSDFTTGSTPNVDEDGHGTHVAGTAAGLTSGVARMARLHSVRVLNQYGSGTISDVIRGIAYVVSQHNQKANKRSIANMSLTSGFSVAMNDAVAEVTAAGVLVVAAAGNDGSDVGSVSPGSSSDALTVACSTEDDTICSFSNTGRGVDIFAPGNNVLSASTSGGYKLLSGTSMSAPHVAGAVAVHLASMSDSELPTPQASKEWIIGRATSPFGFKKNQKSPDKFLYANCV